MAKRPSGDIDGFWGAGQAAPEEFPSRGHGALEDSEGPGRAASGDKRARLYTDEEVRALVRDALDASARAPVPRLMEETFTPKDPVHGLMRLPALVRLFVDTRIFQRMRHIKQLAMCSLVYPGATHNRFFHSIGTAFLAHELVKGLRQRQPELGITDRDVLCVTLAALCHDLGHPCYSHMFEVFIASVGADRRRTATEAARQRGLDELPPEEEAEVRRFETWTHEVASIRLVDLLFKELEGPLWEAGLRADAQGDDFECIRELIDPPKRRLEEELEAGRLRDAWPGLIKGRPLEKAWLYEIVSNWRSGIDVDKFDYFRRDAHYLGIQRQFDHDRYLKCVRVVADVDSVPTVSPPEKDKDTLRDNMLELRKTLHHMAYQHKSVKKLECHMIDILKMMDEHVRIRGSGGREMSMSQAAVEVDAVAYPKLMDTFVEAQLLTCDDPRLEPAIAEYDRCITRRNLMRLVANWDLPRVGEEYNAKAGPMPLPKPEHVIAAVHEGYARAAEQLRPEVPPRAVARSELRCQVAAFHYGMGGRDPISRVVFHTTKLSARRGLRDDGDAKPLRHKAFVFWNPPAGKPSDELTLQRLTRAFDEWATHQVDLHEASAKALASPSPRKAGPSPVAMGPPVQPPEPRPRRALRIQASCPVGMDDPF